MAHPGMTYDLKGGANTGWSPAAVFGQEGF
jgi:hypothetical protein